MFTVAPGSLVGPRGPQSCCDWGPRLENEPGGLSKHPRGSCGPGPPARLSSEVLDPARHYGEVHGSRVPCAGESFELSTPHVSKMQVYDLGKL